MNTQNPIQLKEPPDACVIYLERERLVNLLTYGKSLPIGKSYSYYIPLIGVVAVSFSKFIFVLEGVNLSDEIFESFIQQANAQ